jgi:hypothetical protein
MMVSVEKLLESLVKGFFGACSGWSVIVYG